MPKLKLHMEKKGGVYRVKDFEFTEETIADWHKELYLEGKFREAKTIQEKWGILREIYKHLEPEIMQAGKEGKLGLVDPYPVDWVPHFTPIEYDAWFSIRAKGLGLYPQYPVFNYFLDFGNPFLKIGVEMDGARFHNPERDKVRDLKLLDYGWTIYRIAGRECKKDYRSIGEILEDDWISEHEKQKEIKDYFLTTCDGVFEALKIVYFKRKRHYRSEYFRFAAETLKQHRLVGSNVELEMDADLEGYF
jgi:very-short-patch-repair endonuclease